MSGSESFVGVWEKYTYEVLPCPEAVVSPCRCRQSRRARKTDPCSGGSSPAAPPVLLCMPCSSSQNRPGREIKGGSADGSRLSLPAMYVAIVSKMNKMHNASLCRQTPIWLQQDHQHHVQSSPGAAGAFCTGTAQLCSKLLSVGNPTRQQGDDIPRQPPPRVAREPRPSPSTEDTYQPLWRLAWFRPLLESHPPEMAFATIELLRPLLRALARPE